MSPHFDYHRFRDYLDRVFEAEGVRDIPWESYDLYEIAVKGFAHAIIDQASILRRTVGDPDVNGFIDRATDILATVSDYGIDSIEISTTISTILGRS